jgi:hypothetical protein
VADSGGSIAGWAVGAGLVAIGVALLAYNRRNYLKIRFAMDSAADEIHRST